MFKLLKRNKSLKVIFDTFLVTLPGLANVGGLLILLLYIYAILGLNLFATVQLSGDLDLYINFQSIGKSMLTLYRVSTGENWQNVMHGLSKGQSIQF